MTRFTKLLLLCLLVVFVLACGVKLPTENKTVNTPTHVITEPDEALSSLRDLPTVTPAPFVVTPIAGKAEKWTP